MHEHYYVSIPGRIMDKTKQIANIRQDDRYCSTQRIRCVMDVINLYREAESHYSNCALCQIKSNYSPVSGGVCVSVTGIVEMFTCQE